MTAAAGSCSAAISSSMTLRIWVGPRSAELSISRRLRSKSMILCWGTQ